MRKYGIPVSITLLILFALKTNRYSTDFQQVVDEKQNTAAKKFLGFNFIFCVTHSCDVNQLLLSWDFKQGGYLANTRMLEPGRRRKGSNYRD